jgi:hypothetical protein
MVDKRGESGGTTKGISHGGGDNAGSKVLNLPLAQTCQELGEPFRRAAEACEKGKVHLAALVYITEDDVASFCQGIRGKITLGTFALLHTALTRLSLNVLDAYDEVADEREPDD